MTDPSGDARDTPTPQAPPASTRRAPGERAAGTRSEQEVRDDATSAFPHMKAARSEFEAQFAHARDQFEEANERIKERTGRDLILAIGIGLAIGAIVVASLIVLKWVFVVFAFAVAALGTFEFGRALRAAGYRFDPVPQLLGAAVLIPAGFFLDIEVMWGALFAVVALIIVWRGVAQAVARDGRGAQEILRDIAVGVLVQVYVPFMAATAMILLRQDGGEWWVLAFLAVTVASDTGAYATGLAIGRHPMAPRVSPKKTWEGFGGAFVAAVVTACLLAWLMLGLPWWTGLILGAVILLTATVGDLGESMLKRDLGIKDMSSWLPGHGGVLDRLDSILPSAPAALALFFLFSHIGAV